MFLGWFFWRISLHDVHLYDGFSGGWRTIQKEGYLSDANGWDYQWDMHPTIYKVMEIQTSSKVISHQQWGPRNGAGWLSMKIVGSSGFPLTHEIDQGMFWSPGIGKTPYPANSRHFGAGTWGEWWWLGTWGEWWWLGALWSQMVVAEDKQVGSGSTASSMMGPCLWMLICRVCWH